MQKLAYLKNIQGSRFICDKMRQKTPITSSFWLTLHLTDQKHYTLPEVTRRRKTQRQNQL
jgi:hypothetical protein